MILVQEFASTIHHLQRPNEFLVNFKPPEKVEKTSTTSPPIFFKTKAYCRVFFVGGLSFSGGGETFQEYKFGDISKEAAKRAKSAMANLLGQVVEWELGVVWSWMGAGSGKYLPKILHTYMVDRVGRYLN